MNAPFTVQLAGPIYRLVLALGADRPERRTVAVLVCKLDASGTDAANPVLTMAGYVGMLSGWLDFEVRARALFDERGVSVLRAKPFYDTDGEFAGWGRVKKEGFIRSLHENCILGRLDLGVSVSVNKASFLQMKRDRDIGHNESVFGFALRFVLARLLSDVVLEAGFRQGLSLTVVHESGDENDQDAVRVFNEIKKVSPEHNRRLQSIGFADKASSIGLQIGDFLAGTSRKYVNKTDALGAYPEQPAILEILRNGIYLIDDVVVDWTRP